MTISLLIRSRTQTELVMFSELQKPFRTALLAFVGICLFIISE